MVTPWNARSHETFAVGPKIGKDEAGTHLIMATGNDGWLTENVSSFVKRFGVAALA